MAGRCRPPPCHVAGRVRYGSRGRQASVKTDELETAALRQLYLRARRCGLAGIRGAIISALAGPWRYDAERARIYARYLSAGEDVIPVAYAGTPDLPACCLMLCEQGRGYAVAAIVPRAPGDLTVSAHNLLLEEFTRAVCVPASGGGRLFDMQEDPTNPSVQRNKFRVVTLISRKEALHEKCPALAGQNASVLPGAVAGRSDIKSFSMS